MSLKPSLNHLFVFVVITLAGASSFFTLQVFRFKGSLRSGAAGAPLTSGQQVPAVRALDGDELVVDLGSGQLTVRLLGIATYDPTMNDPMVQPWALQALRFLEVEAVGKPVRLHFEEYKLDAKKRLLAYVHLEQRDLGLEMIQRGLALAYTRYPVTRQDVYLAAQDQARKQRLGLWAEPALVNRSEQLRVLWDRERTKED